MSGILDLCAIDAGQSNTRFLVFDDGKELLEEETGLGVANILLSGAKEALRENLDLIRRRPVPQPPSSPRRLRRTS